MVVDGLDKTITKSECVVGLNEKISNVDTEIMQNMEEG